MAALRPAAREYGLQRLIAVAIMVGLIGASWQPRPAHAADAAVDAGLLEFLGSVDSDNKDWRDYLAASKRNPGTQAPPTSSAPAPSPKPAPAAAVPPTLPANPAAAPIPESGA